MKYDVIVIGAGPGGYPAAIRLAQLGKRVLVVEKQAVGGVCLNWGCIPTKALCHAAEIRASTGFFQRIGLGLESSTLEFGKLQQWKESVVTKLVKGVEFLFKSNGVELLKGTAKITGPGRIRVEGEATQEVEADAMIVATGSAPTPLPAIEPDDRNILYAERALFFKSVPQSMLVIGAGATGLEMATIYNAFGTRITLVEILDQPSPGLDKELATNLEKLLAKQGIDLHLRSKVIGLDHGYTNMRVKIESNQGETTSKEVEKVLLAVGRRPLTDDLWADSIGIDTDSKGFIKVNERLETSVPGIYAIGDVTGPPLLAHRATRQGIVAAEVIAGDKAAAYDPAAMPSCIFTIPPAASVGLSEEQATAKGLDIEIGRFPYSALGRAAALGERDGFVKIIAEKGSGRLLGMHVLGVGADLVIGEGIMGLEMVASIEDIGSSVHPHPTLLEAVMEAAENVRKRAIHIKN
ncbi:dihydrolipoyl dehydrogenase [candidate division WOR-3 bacterium]|nr:dihydrolipoyl dehydrogenase [candidate division WOR-3 bacterium]